MRAKLSLQSRLNQLIWKMVHIKWWLSWSRLIPSISKSQTEHICHPYLPSPTFASSLPPVSTLAPTFYMFCFCWLCCHLNSFLPSTKAYGREENTYIRTWYYTDIMLSHAEPITAGSVHRQFQDFFFNLLASPLTRATQWRLETGNQRAVFTWSLSLSGQVSLYCFPL